MLTERSLSPEEAAHLVSQWVNDELLYQAALNNGLQHDMSIERALDQYRRELLGRTYLSLARSSGITVSQEEINAAYEENIEEFYRPVDEARINHFIVADNDEAQRIRRILTGSRSGADRREIFNTYQVESMTIRRGALVQELDDAIFGRNPRTNIIGPVATDRGYHVIEVLERNKEGTYRDRDDVYDELRHRLYQNYASLNSIKILDSLRSVADIEINLGNINP
ncbi:MAG: peptidylprolyl isomerase [Candidatus Neomarinimicrobiota bacterium]